MTTDQRIAARLVSHLDGVLLAKRTEAARHAPPQDMHGDCSVCGGAGTFLDWEDGCFVVKRCTCREGT